MTIHIRNLFTVEVAEKILRRGLAVAKALGLPVDSWRGNDPTRSLYHFAADFFDAQEQRNTQFAKSGFMSTAEGEWATLHAKEVYGVDRGQALYATPTVTLRNDGGGVFDLAPGDLRMQCSDTGKTFTSTDAPGTLAPHTTLTYALVADEAGAASSVAENAIDDFVTPASLGVYGVVIVSSTAAAAQDEQSVPELQDQCGDTLGALSPNGPPDAYEKVCKDSKLTGSTEINRAQTQGDDDSGAVLVYVASAAGVVTAPSVAAAQAAVERWATPRCMRPTVVSATPAPLNVTAAVVGVTLSSDQRAAISAALGKLFLGLPIGGTVYRSRIIAAIHAAVPEIVSVNLSAPAADVAIDVTAVPVLGVVAIG